MLPLNQADKYYTSVTQEETKYIINYFNTNGMHEMLITRLEYNIVFRKKKDFYKKQMRLYRMQFIRIYVRDFPNNNSTVNIIWILKQTSNYPTNVTYANIKEQ